MSNTALIESQSSDPVERAIARRVLRILNDPTLDRPQRMEMVRAAQGDLLQHRAQAQRQAALASRATSAVLPKGWVAKSVQVAEGRVQVGAVNRSQGFAWLDAGEAPGEVSDNQRVQALRNTGKQSGRVRPPG